MESFWEMECVMIKLILWNVLMMEVIVVDLASIQTIVQSAHVMKQFTLIVCITNVTQIFQYISVTPSLRGKWVDFARKETCDISFLRAFHVDFNHVILKMIQWPKLEGSQSKGTMGQALLPVSAVTTEDSNPSLLPKQAERLGPRCLKRGCPLIAVMGSF